MKIICAGLPKTGTKSMGEALRILGYNVHDVFEQFMLDRHLYKMVRHNTASVEDYRKTFEDVDAVTDLPACGLWEQIFEAFPDAKVVLMVRTPEEDWLKSVQYLAQHTLTYLPDYRAGKLAVALVSWLTGPLRHEFMEYLETFVPLCMGVPEFLGTLCESSLRSKYRQHNSYVKAVCPNEQLLVFNVRDGWEPLCKFLGLPVPNVPFPMKNKKASVVDSIWYGTYEHDCGYHKAVMREVYIRFGLMLAFIAAILGCVVFYLTT